MKIITSSIIILITGINLLLIQSIEWTKPIIIDSLPETFKYFETKKIKIPFNQEIYYGQIKDTITVINEVTEYGSIRDISDLENESLDQKIDIEIIPDLSQNLSFDIERYSIPPPPVPTKGSEFGFDKIKSDSMLNIWKKRPRNYVKAYPIFIRNKTQNDIYIDKQDGRLFIIQEAKDINGKWKPIEYWNYSTCGNSYYSTSLGPNDTIIIKKPYYKGKFKTKMRLKLKSNEKEFYSKSYDGSINIEQFDLINIDKWTQRRFKSRGFESIFLK